MEGRIRKGEEERGKEKETLGERRENQRERERKGESQRAREEKPMRDGPKPVRQTGAGAHRHRVRDQ